MSTALANASRLKPDIRLAQAVSHFEADLPSEEKARFCAFRSQSRDSPPATSDVMRLTAEIDRHGIGKVVRGSRCFGPRLTNFLQAVQQFAALGDIVVGSSQNIIACGVWSLVRTSLLVSISTSLTAFSTDMFIADRKLPFLPRKVVDSPHGRRSLGSPLRKDGLALFPVQGSAIVPLRILYCGGHTLSSGVEVYAEVNLWATCVYSKRLRLEDLPIAVRQLGSYN